MSYKSLTLVFDFDASDDKRKEWVKDELAEIENVFLLDELTNGFKYLIQYDSLNDIRDALKEVLNLKRIIVDGQEESLFIVLMGKPDIGVDPAAVSFKKLDEDRLKALF